MKLADIVGGRVVLNQDLWLVPEFKNLYEQDNDHGERVITYIVFNNKWDSPYVTSGDQDTREQRLKKKIFGDENYKLTPEEQIAENEFINFQNTETLIMLNNMRLKLNSISKYYKESINDELDEKKIKDLLAGMTSVGSVIKSIATLEDLVKAERVNMGKVRGDVKINRFEIPD